MTDLSLTIAPKSNQLNADDLIAGPRTIRITTVKAGSAEQPIAIHFEGDDGKPYLPCKSMRRLMVALWGADGKAYAGRLLTLYNDPKVKWGGIEVGGIRISHMSHIEQDTTLALTESKSKRVPHRVRRLDAKAPVKQEQQPEPEAADGQPDFPIERLLEQLATAATYQEAMELAKMANAPQRFKKQMMAVLKARSDAPSASD